MNGITDLADRLAIRFAARADAHDRDGSFPHENWDDLHREGYLRLVIPREHGGAGATLLDMVLAQERLGAGDAGTALGTAMLISVLGRVGETGGWPAPIWAAVCRELAEAGGGINNCVTETELGSISRGGTPATAAVPAPGGWRITGHKIFVTAAPALRFLVTAVVLPPTEDAPRGWMANAIVRCRAEGLRIEPTWRDSLSLRSVGNDDIHYDGVFVPEDWVVDRRPVGAPAGAALPNPWGLPVAAVYLGVGQAACDAACDYANARVPPSLGAPIATQPHIQQAIGSMTIALDAARAVLHEAARAWEQPERRPGLGASLAAAKYLCTNAACTVTETALRVAGGFSLTRSLPLERYFRDARAGLFAPPQDDLALGIVGRAALAARRRRPATRGGVEPVALPLPVLDHVVINVRDRLDEAAEAYRRLGFHLTPRGHHTLGSINNLAILGTDYIELLGVPPGGEGRTDVLDWPEGLNGLVFKTFDADATHAALSDAGVPVLPPQSFSRPVAGGDAAFRTVRLERTAAPAGRLFFCEHATPELVWQDEERRHPNGALGVERAVVASTRPEALLGLFARMFGEDAVEGSTLRAGLARIDVVAPGQLAAEYGDAIAPADGRDDWMAALTVRVGSLARAEASLRGLPGLVARDGGVVVPAAQAFGVAIEFRA